MALLVYRDVPFFAGTQVDQNDFFTGDGVTTAFVLTRKSVSRLAGTVQFDNVQYYQYNQGFVRTINGFNLDSAPPLNSQGVAPGLSNILFDQLFDSAAVPGVAQPNIQEVPFYLAAPDDAPLFTYTSIPSRAGIAMSIVNMVTAAAAATSWIQLACATTDAAGSPLTYQASGTTLYTGNFQVYGTILASSANGATSMMADSASGFIVGDYILINGGLPTQEVTKIIGYTAPTTLRTTGTSFQHFAGETIYTCGRKFWMKCTVPLGISQGQPTNYYGLSLRTLFAKRSRL